MDSGAHMSGSQEQHCLRLCLPFTLMVINLSTSKWILQKLGHEGLNNMLMDYRDKYVYALCDCVYFLFLLGQIMNPLGFE
nr:inosine triphosphate pyrophosphatase isoform X1 [Tanacetum cinerariifolium]